MNRSARLRFHVQMGLSSVMHWMTYYLFFLALYIAVCGLFLAVEIAVDVTLCYRLLFVLSLEALHRILE